MPSPVKIIIVPRSFVEGDLVPVYDGKHGNNNCPIISVGPRTVVVRNTRGWTITLLREEGPKKAKHTKPRIPYAGGKKAKPRGKSAKLKEISNAD